MLASSQFNIQEGIWYYIFQHRIFKVSLNSSNILLRYVHQLLNEINHCKQTLSHNQLLLPCEHLTNVKKKEYTSLI